MGFGERLAAAIEAAGLNQNKLAKELGVSRATVHSWIKGTHGMKAAHIKLASKPLKVDVETIAEWMHESVLEELGVAKKSRKGK
jgi:transcriptional regulator with XRE-family HTH domain